MQTFLYIVASLFLGAPVLAQSASMARASAAPSDAVPDGLSDGDWSSIRAAYEAGRHRVIAAEDGLEARNPGQQWTTRFDGRGFCTTPDASGWTFGLELVRYGWGDAEGAVEKARAVSADGGRVAYEWDDRLTEWYVNDSRGLEHGYTVGARPAAASGPLTLTLAVRGKLVAEIAAGGRDVRFVDATGALVLSYAGLTVFDADGRALVAGFETLDGRLKLTVEDLGARYPLTIDPVVQQAYLKASNTDPLDLFGEAIAVSGDTVVVGAPWEDSNATGVNGNQSDNSRFDSGAAYVFVRSGTSWSQQAYLKASDTSAADYFGGSVAISGDTLVVGAAGEDSNATGVDGNQNDYSKYDSGAAYVFVRSGTSWSQQAYLKASNTGVGDHFGDKVAVSGDTVVVGAHAESSNATGVNGNQSDDSMPASGATYVFVRSGTSWSQQAYLKASNTDAVDLFGSAVAVSGDTIVVGAWLEASNATGVNGNQSDNSMSYSGAAYVFVRSGTSWSQQAYLKASNTNGDDYFGVAVAVSGDTVVVGATGEDSNAVGVNGNQNDNSMASSGAAYVFVRSGTSWSQQAYLKASNTDASDNFGGVAVSGDTIVVGAPWEDSNATGVNGNQSDNSRSNSGAAYVFVRNGTSWSQQAYLKASNGGAGDLFGSVALSGGTVVVAADAEDSTATGVNGNQRSNGKRDSGAAYVFELDEAGGRGMGSFATYGTGTPGTGGLVPSIELVGSPNIGADIWLVIRDGLGGAPAIVLIGPGRDNVSYAGGALLVAVSAILTPTLGGPPGVAGAGTLRITDAIPDDPALSGVFVDFQVLVTDAAAVQGVALSNGAELKIGG